MEIKEKRKGCGKLTYVDYSDKGFGSWQCGQYYDSFEGIYLCNKCKSKEAKSK